jgi:hypothetical protein
MNARASRCVIAASVESPQPKPPANETAPPLRRPMQRQLRSRMHFQIHLRSEMVQPDRAGAQRRLAIRMRLQVAVVLRSTLVATVVNRGTTGVLARAMIWSAQVGVAAPAVASTKRNPGSAWSVGCVSRTALKTPHGSAKSVMRRVTRAAGAIGRRTLRVRMGCSATAPSGVEAAPRAANASAPPARVGRQTTRAGSAMRRATSARSRRSSTGRTR